jgi:hypothetical protein
MSVFLVVEGNKIKLEPNSDWKWQGFNGEISLKGTKSLLSVEKKRVIIKTDFPQTHNLGKSYSTQTHSTQGTIKSVLLSVDDKTLSTQIFSKEACVTEKTSGSFQAVVSQPASTPNNVLDPVSPKQGQWHVVESGQEIMAVEATAPQSLFLETPKKQQVPTEVVPSYQEKLGTKAKEKPMSHKKDEDIVENILVIVAGTVDPCNINSLKRANSYKSEVVDSKSKSNYYWEDSPSLVRKIQETTEKYTNFHFFTVHGWSGDNAVINRKTAGAYLADRLCGSNGEDCYYPKFKDRNVSFHFIGHSHGGNVINEITKRMAENPEWPEKWKVKTIVYLSTPFFQELHQVNTAKFHENCKILNVFNKYDLTQRVIANFSLKHFPKLETVLNNNISRLFNDIATFDMTVLKALHKKPSNSDIFLKAFLHVFSFQLIPVEINWYMGVQAGKKLYTECGKLFSNIDSLLDETQKIVKFLNTEVELKLPKGLKGKVPSQRQIISDALKARFLGKLRTIQDGLAQTIQAFEKRMEQDKYPMLGFFDDVSAFINPILDLLRINSENLTGEFSNLVYEILIEQIDRYDNTTNSPVHQLPNKYKSSPVNVTKHDPYCGMREQQFDRFMSNTNKAIA